MRTLDSDRSSPCAAALRASGAAALSAICLFLSLFSGCKHEPTDPWSDSPIVRGPAPPLSDPVPYALLGSGRLAFVRVSSNQGHSFNILDADILSSTGFSMQGFDMFPAISPDGKKIAFTFLDGVGDTGSYWDIAIMQNDGSGIEHLTAMEFYEECPAWSTDGNLLYFYHRTATSVLCSQSPVPNAPNVRTVLAFTRSSPSSPVSAAPDGMFALSRNTEIGREISLVRPDGTTSMIACDSTVAPSRLIAPAFSPDGKTAVYISEPRDSTGMYYQLSLIAVDIASTMKDTIITVPISGSRQWVDGSYSGLSVCWSPDGKRLAFTRPSGDYCIHIWLVNVDGTGLTQVTSSPGASDRFLTWSR